MIRLYGVHVSEKKHTDIALMSIYGIGRSLAGKLCNDCNINPSIKIGNLIDKDLDILRKKISNLRIEGDLRREVSMNIKRLIDLASYRGSRHRKKLPVRGQRTRCNARTRKGKAIAIAGKKLTPLKK
jgi:small subunit ribosomal protein S13